MKKLLVSSLLVMAATTLFGQNDACKIQIKINNNEFTEAKFNLKLGTETLSSVNGVITIPKEKLKKNSNAKVILTMEDSIVFGKLYEKPEIFKSEQILKNLCGIYILKRK